MTTVTMKTGSRETTYTWLASSSCWAWTCECGQRGVKFGHELIKVLAIRDALAHTCGEQDTEKKRKDIDS